MWLINCVRDDGADVERNRVDENGRVLKDGMNLRR